MSGRNYYRAAQLMTVESLARRKGYRVEESPPGRWCVCTARGFDDFLPVGSEDEARSFLSSLPDVSAHL